MAALPAEPSHSRRVILVVVIVIVLVVASLAVYLETGNQHGTTSAPPALGTTTTTVTLPCPTSFTTQTSTTTSSSGNKASNHGPDFGPLLGNFSALTVILFGNSSNGKSFESYSMAVLNRSSTPSGPIYEVNATTELIESQVSVSGTQYTTTTIVSPGNVTTVGSVLADVARNGSVVSLIRFSGNLSGPPLPPFILAPLILQNYSSSNSRTVGTSTITIGTTRMSVTNLERPSLVYSMIQEGCGSQPATTTTETISNWEVQVGTVPGTNFTLTTRYSLVYSIQSNSTTPSSSEFTATEEVTGFTVA